ncbi:MAG: TIGR00730 family Rossman fold protein [Alphaproteobacteria bacterium]|nr:TIGR00730 family Rossman fold protein [Alphaproteobacteria bacterium]
MSKYKALAIFGSSSDDINPQFIQPAYDVGALLAKKGITMIYGVGDGGLMGAAFRGVRSESGKVLGITIPVLFKRQCADPSIYQEGELQIVETLHERKHLMMESADALLIMPGGWGTIDEVASFGVHTKIGDRTKKPLIFLNFKGFWNPMKEMIDNMLENGAVKPDQIAFVDFANAPDEIFPAIERAQKRISK